MTTETHVIGYMTENDFWYLRAGDTESVEVYAWFADLRDAMPKDAFSAQKVYKVKVTILETVKEGETDGQG